MGIDIRQDLQDYYDILFIMGPHSENMDYFFPVIHIINQPMLNIYPPGIKPLQISNQFFICRGHFERIFC